MALELLEILTGTSWASRMAGGQASQRRGGSQGPANPKKAQAKGKSRSPRDKGGGTAKGDQGGGARERAASGTPAPKSKGGYRSRQGSRQPRSPRSSIGTPRLAEASQEPVGFRKPSGEPPVMEVDSSTTPDCQQDDPPSGGFLHEDGPHARKVEVEEEVKIQSSHKKKEKDGREEDSDEAFRRVYLEQLRWSAEAFKRREAKENLEEKEGAQSSGEGRGEGGDREGEVTRGGSGEGGDATPGKERPFFPTWSGLPA